MLTYREAGRDGLCEPLATYLRMMRKQGANSCPEEGLWGEISKANFHAPDDPSLGGYYSALLFNP